MLTPQKVRSPDGARSRTLRRSDPRVAVYRLGDNILYSMPVARGFFTFVFFHPDRKIAGMIFVTASFRGELRKAGGGRYSDGGLAGD